MAAEARASFLASDRTYGARRVVGWSMGASMEARLVTDALIMAIWRGGKPEALWRHSDLGSQYASDHCQRLMADHGVACSMSRAGAGRDDAAMESSSRP